MENAARQLRIGDHAQPTAPVSFLTDDRIVETLARVDVGLVQVQNGLEHLEALVPSMRRAVGTARALLDSLSRQLDVPKVRT